jgi:internalin A
MLFICLLSGCAPSPATDKKTGTSFSKEENGIYFSLKDALANPGRVRQLIIQGEEAKHLPADLKKLTKLTRLLIDSDSIIELPGEISSLTSLKELELYGEILVLPDNFTNLLNLESLHIDNASILNSKEVAVIKKMPALKKLALCNAHFITQLPTDAFSSNLRTLDISGPSLDVLPSFLSSLPDLQELHFTCAPEFADKVVPAFPVLKKLNIDYYNPASLDNVLKLFAHQPKIESLQMTCLSKNGAIDNPPAEIQSFNQLKKLHLLDARRMNGNAFFLLTGKLQLDELILENSLDKLNENLCLLSQLTSLKITCDTLNISGVFGCMQKLSSLSLQVTAIKNEKSLTLPISLDTLDLYVQHIGDRNSLIASLKPLKELKRLNVSSGIGENKAELKSILPRNCNLYISKPISVTY